MEFSGNKILPIEAVNVEGNENESDLSKDENLTFLNVLKIKKRRSLISQRTSSAVLILISIHYTYMQKKEDRV